MAENTSGNMNSSNEIQETLFVSFLGQSNNQNMSIVYDPYQQGSLANDTSGAIVLNRELSDISGSNVVTSDTPETNFAIGGSKVNGNGYYQEDSTVWWYPEQNIPGGALRQAEQRLDSWLSEKGATATDDIAIIWSQGESDVGDVSSGTDTAREQYKQSTLAVFDDLRRSLNYDNINFISYRQDACKQQEQPTAVYQSKRSLR